jgi:hypothetical protein
MAEEGWGVPFWGAILGVPFLTEQEWQEWQVNDRVPDMIGGHERRGGRCGFDSRDCPLHIHICRVQNGGAVSWRRGKRYREKCHSSVSRTILLYRNKNGTSKRVEN